MVEGADQGPMVCLVGSVSSATCGWFSDRIGRRWAMIIPALFVIPLAPFYLFSDNLAVIAVAFALQGLAGSGGMFGQVPSSLNERFPTEVRATATTRARFGEDFVRRSWPISRPLGSSAWRYRCWWELYSGRPTSSLCCC